MLNLFTTNPAVALLKEDHAAVQALFDRFETAKGRAAKVKIARLALIGEARMVEAAKGKGDSPARAARRKAPKLPIRGG